MHHGYITEHSRTGPDHRLYHIDTHTLHIESAARLPQLSINTTSVPEFITPDDIKVSGMLIEINQVAEEDLFMRKFHRTYKFCEFLIRKGSNEIMYGNFVS